jgi:hypothetical protein
MVVTVLQVDLQVTQLAVAVVLQLLAVLLQLIM